MKTCFILPFTLLAALPAASGAAEPSPSPGDRREIVITAARPKAVLGSVEAANRAALVEPSDDRYVNAGQVYRWSDNAIYRLYAAPGLVSDIALQPGEQLLSVAAGDTLRWVIGDTTSGSGHEKRTHILVKPADVGLSTNLVVATDRRVYLLKLESSDGAAMAAISWTYPEDELLALRKAGEAAAEAVPVAADVAVEQLNFNYSIEGDRPFWRPVRAFDDGRQVFVEFPASIGSGELPPLFVIGSSGKAELTNYRLRGRYYVVGRLFSAAELRLGEKKQQIVRIVRTDARRVVRGRLS